MKRIKTLTDEQAARMPGWVEKWTQVGLCTDPANFDAAERAARSCYASAGYPQPRVVLRMGSPMGATIGGIYASLLLGELSKLGKSIVGDIGRQVEPGIDRQVHMKVDQRIGGHVDELVDERVDAEVYDLVYNKVDRQLIEHVEREVYDCVVRRVDQPVKMDIDGEIGKHVVRQVYVQAEMQPEEQPGSQLYKQTVERVREDVLRSVHAGVSRLEQLDAEAWRSVVEKADAQMVGHMRSYWTHYRACQLCAGWYAYVTFFRDMCGWENEALDAFAYDEILARTCGWSWWGKDVCALSDRPLAIRRNDQGQLHCVGDAAMVYRDGWSIWALDGVRAKAVRPEVEICH